MPNKRELFPLTTKALGRPPTRADLFWTRNHLVQMTDGLNSGMSPYVYMHTLPEGLKLRYIVSDLNSLGSSLWPVRLTTNARIGSARHVLKTLRSRLHTILKDYP
jgi:hypothetical protein